MAFRTQKISQMTPKGADLEATDLIEVSTIESGSYVTRSITGQELIDAIPLPPTGLTVGTTPIASGTIGRVLFQGTGNELQQSGNLFWDNTNGRLGIGTSSPPSILFLRNGPAPMFGIDTISSQTEIAVYNQATYQKALKIDGNGGVTWENGTAITPNNNGIYFQNTATTTPVRILGNPTNTTIFHVTDNTGSTGLFMVKGATGNVLINTTTDAGFKLDVNGTARVQGALNVTTSVTANTASSGTGYEGYKIQDGCLLYTSPSPRDRQKSRMPSSA